METPASPPHSRPRLIFVAAFALTALASCAPADPAAYAEQQWRICQGSTLQQQQLDACSAVIASTAVEPARKAEALVMRGVVRGQMTQDARAVADFGRALRINPDHVSAYLERGELHFHREAWTAAIRDFEAALQRSPNLEQAISMRAAAQRALEDGRLSELEFLTRALAERPFDATLWNNRCWSRAVRGEELEIALADCNEAIRLEPRSPASLDSRGLVNLKRGDYPAAIADYNAALALEPGRGHYLYGRGVARVRMGDRAAGLADMDSAEIAEPGIGITYSVEYGVTL